MTRTDAPTLELLLRHQSLVRSIARDLLVDPDAADDVVQQTWLAALRHAATGAQVGRSLLARIATNLAFNRRRDTRRRETRERRAAVAEPLPSVAELVEREDERRRVVEAVFALHEPLRETVLRRYLDDRSEDDVAAVLGIPVGTVRSRLRHARALLREKLERDGDAPRSARAIAALAGWSVNEAAAAIAGGKGVVLMGVKAWVGVAAGVVVAALVTTITWRTMRSEAPRRDGAQTALASDVRDSLAMDPPADENAAPTDAVRSATTAMVPASGAAPARRGVRTRTIRGRCVTPERTPVEGAIVSSRDFAQTATTDAAGRFAISAEVGDKTSVGIAARAPGRGRAARTMTVDRHGALEFGELVLARAATIRGRVLDEADRPVPATLELRSGDANDISWQMGTMTRPPDYLEADGVLARADVAGRFAFENANENWYSLVALHPDYVTVAPVPVPTTAGATVDVVVRVRAARDDERIRGRLLDAEGRACAGATITWGYTLRSGGTSHMGSRRLTTDVDGRISCFATVGSENAFTFSELAGQKRAFKLRPVGERMPGVRGVHGGDAEFVLRLEAPRLTTIRVVDAESGAPCADASIDAIAIDRSDARYATTDVTGAATLAVPKSEFQLEITSPLHESTRLGPFPGDVDLALDIVRLTGRKACLRGTVAGCDAEAAAGAKVSVHVVDPRQPVMERSGFPLLSPRQVVSALVHADGTFEIPLGTVDPAAVRAFARVEIDGFAATQLELPVPDPLGASPITLTVSAGGSIEGHVTAPASRSPAGLIVIAGNDEIDFVMTGVAEDGSYRLDHLRPGMWRVAALVEDPAYMMNATDRTYPPPDVEVHEGGSTRRDVTCQSAGVVALTGTIRLSGVALPMKVEARGKLPEGLRGFGTVFSRSRSVVKPSGAFELEVETPGTYRFEARLTTDMNQLTFERPIDLVPGSNDVTLDVPCGIVTGTCAHRSSDGRVSIRDKLADGTSFNVSATCAPDGTFTLPFVPAGHFKITGRDSKEIDVRAGETTTVELK